MKVIVERMQRQSVVKIKIKITDYLIDFDVCILLCCC